MTGSMSCGRGRVAAEVAGPQATEGSLMRHATARGHLVTATQRSEQQAARGADARRLTSWLRRLRQRQSTLSTLIPLVLLWIALTIASPHFLTFDNAVNVLLNAAPLALIAGGMTLALIAAEIDPSVGSVVALVGSLAALLSVNFGVPWPLVLLGALAAGGRSARSTGGSPPGSGCRRPRPPWRCSGSPGHRAC